MMEWARRATRRVVGEATLSPWRAVVVGALIVGGVLFIVFNPVDRPLRLGTGDGEVDTATPVEAPDVTGRAAATWEVPTWSSDGGTWTPTPGDTDEPTTDPTPDPAETPTLEDDAIAGATPVIDAFLGIYYNPPEGDEATEEWLAEFESLATPAMLAGLQYVNPSLIPDKGPGEVQLVRVSGSFVEAEYVDGDGVLIRVAAQGPEGWRVHRLAPADDIDL